MVKKFFRKIFKKNNTPESGVTDHQHPHSQDEKNSVSDSQMMEEEDGSYSEEVDFKSTVLEEEGENESDESQFQKEVTSIEVEEFEIDELPSPSKIDDIEDLPDLPKEVIRAIKQAEESDHVTEFDNEVTDQEEDFNFTEIKANKDHEKEVPFEFNELKVDLPTSSKINKFKNLTQNIIKSIKNIGNNYNYNDGAPKPLLPPEKKAQVHQLFIVILVMSSCYYSGKIVSFLLSSQQPLEMTSNLPLNNNISSTEEEITSLEQLNPFDALLTSKKPDKNKKEVPKKVVIDENKICDQSSKASSLKIDIDTLIVLQDRTKSIASIKLKNKPQYIREGEKINGMAIIGAIKLDKIIFRNLKNGICEYLAAPKKKQSRINQKFSRLKIHPAEKAKDFISSDPNIKVEGNNYKIDKKIRNELLDNITDVLSQARAVQIKNSDGSLSFKIVEIVPGSIYSKLNIQENDIITKINGDKIDNLNEIMTLFGRIKDLKSLELGIEREGIENDFQYSFE